MTVAMDTMGDPVVRKYIDQAQPTHPTLLDTAHVTGELFGFVNVPNAVWIDEDLRIVRPPEGAPMRGAAMPRFTKEQFDELPPAYKHTMTLASRIDLGDVREYEAAIEDWVEHGAASRFALTPDEVLARCTTRTADQSRAAACFEIGQELQQRGLPDAAVPWFALSHELFPGNWTYRRQAWSIVDPVGQDPTGVYDTSWVAELERTGPENYYVKFSG